MIKKVRSTLPVTAALTAGLAVGASLVVVEPVAQARAPISSVLLGATANPVYYDRPATFRTAAGSYLVTARVAGDGRTRNIVLMRRHGTSAFSRVTVPQTIAGSPIRVTQTPRLIQSGRTIRMVTQAEVPALNSDYVGLYSWTSTNDGASWTAPVRLKKSFFGSNELAPDGAGGYWALSELTGVQAIHVSAGVHPAAASTMLSDRVGSRLWVHLASAGAKRTLLAGFFTSKGSWLHVGSAAGRSHDVAVFGKAATVADLAGDAKRGVIVAIHPQGYRSSAITSVYARSITFGAKGGLVLGKEVRLSGLHEQVPAVSGGLAVQSLPGGTGRFLVAWLNDAGQLRIARSAASGAWSAAVTSYTFGGGTHVYNAAGSVAPAPAWTAVSAVRNRDGKNVWLLVAS